MTLRPKLGTVLSFYFAKTSLVRLEFCLDVSLERQVHGSRSLPIILWGWSLQQRATAARQPLSFKYFGIDYYCPGMDLDT